MSTLLFKSRVPECNMTTRFPIPGTQLTRLYCELEKISNTHISGINKNVKISFCANINIRGDKNLVELSEISNHNLKLSSVR